MSENALIVGAGQGLSAALARCFAAEGMRVTLAARDAGKLDTLAGELGAAAFACDATREGDVADLFRRLDGAGQVPDVVVYNPSRRVRGQVADLDPAEVQASLQVTCYGGFLVAREAARRMRARGSGSILFTGASASVKGYPESACFAMGKFALRGLAQSMARELHPQNVHVAHFVIDGAIAAPGRSGGGRPDDLLDPGAIARSYLHVHRQHRSAWTFEVELRPWLERF